MTKRKDLTGQSFGELTVLSLSNETGVDGTRLWACQCSCGNIINVYAYSLQHGHYKSCGCKHAEKRDKGLEEHIKKDTIEGTRVTALQAKLHSGNKSGHKGVMYIKQRNKWRAYIGFKGKQINLGHFSNMEEAVAARQAAEEKYYKPYLDK